MPVLLTPVVNGAQVKASDINQYLACVVAQSYLMSGTTPSVPVSSLTLAYGVQQATILDSGTNAAIFVYLAAGTSTFGANQDIYVDLGYSGGYNGSAANGTLTMVAGANGFTPSATPSGQLRLWKVVTGASAITSVTLLAPTVALPTSAGAASGVPTLTAGSLVVQDPASKSAASGVAALDSSTLLVAAQQRGVRQVVACKQTSDITLSSTAPGTAYTPSWDSAPGITTLAANSRVRVRWTTALTSTDGADHSVYWSVLLDAVSHYLGSTTAKNGETKTFSGLYVSGALAAGSHTIALTYQLGSGTSVVVNAASAPYTYNPYLEIEEIL